MRAIKIEGQYRLYKIENHYELWMGTIEDGCLVNDDMMYPVEDFLYYVGVAEEEMRSLISYL